MDKMDKLLLTKLVGRGPPIGLSSIDVGREIGNGLPEGYQHQSERERASVLSMAVSETDGKFAPKGDDGCADPTQVRGGYNSTVGGDDAPMDTTRSRLPASRTNSSPSVDLKRNEGGRSNADGSGGTLPPISKAGHSGQHPPPLRLRGGDGRRRQTKGRVQIGSLNLRGANGDNTRSRWSKVMGIMKIQKIGILAVQETHSTDDLITSLNQSFGPRFEIHHTWDADNPTSKGVAIIIDTYLMTRGGVQIKNLENGRALLATVPWRENLNLNILAVYAPCNSQENKMFWRDLNTKWTQENSRLPKVDIMLGDLNMTEAPEDRWPSRPENGATVRSLQELKATLNLQDGWRRFNPFPVRRHTYAQSGAQGHSRSRIDRIYATEDMCNRSIDWRIHVTGIEGLDHSLITATLTDDQVPYIGKGRWAMSIETMKSPWLAKYADAKLKKLVQDMDEARNDVDRELCSPQTLYAKCFSELKSDTQKYEKARKGKLESRLKNLEADYYALTAEDPTLEREDHEHTAKFIRNKIEEIRTQMSSRALTNSKVLAKLHQETVSKEWCKKGKLQKPRDIIQRLQSPTDPQKYLTRSDQIADGMAEYYNSTQDVDTETVNENEKAAATAVTLEHVTKVPQDIAEKLQGSLSYEEVAKALNRAPNGKAAGMNGIPTEFFKSLNDRYKSTQEREEPSVNVIYILWRLYNDIEVNGIDSRANSFLDGWICPLYKKADRHQAKNHRPITVLNAEYKIFTTALMMKVQKATAHIIHETQAAFMPGRSIFNQINLVKYMIDFCQADEQDGVIIALDQEKAYDRITHEYLWKVLKETQLPESLINTIQSLYSQANSCVIVNGEISESFRVKRGVRQGDPLSCILFLIAIEPLSSMIRNSPVLKGLSVKDTTDRIHKILLALFADDATAFLSKEDSLSSLQTILDTWCCASGAKFNIAKTKIIPVGSHEYRQSVIETRRINPNSEEEVPEVIELIRDGESHRILGAHLGNHIDPIAPWAKIIEKINIRLNHWNRTHPTMIGRRLIVQMIVGGMTQFITAAQGMPRSIEKQLTKIIRSFMWDSSHPSVSLKTLQLPAEEGGLGVLNLETRNEAIYMMKLKEMTNMGASRHIWADVANRTIFLSLPTTEQNRVEPNARLNFFYQSIYRISRYPSTKLSDELAKIMSVAAKYNISVDSPRLPERHRRELPAWNHIGKMPGTRRKENLATSRCLRFNHGVETTEQLMLQELIYESEELEHEHGDKHCRCEKCDQYRQSGCSNPDLCYVAAIKLLKDLSPKFSPWYDEFDEEEITEEAQEEFIKRQNAAFTAKEKVPFEKTLQTIGNIGNNIRILGDPEEMSTEPAQRAVNEALDENVHGELIEIYTDGSCTNNGDLDAKAGSGIWYGPHDPRNAAVRVGENLPQTSNVGEMAAILHVARTVPSHVNVHILTDSTWTIRSLTVNLENIRDQDYSGIANGELIRATDAALKRREGSTIFTWVKGHADIEGNEGADALAAEGAMLPGEDDLNLDLPENFRCPGVKLSKASQKTLYRAICRKKNKLLKPRSSVTETLQQVREAAKDISGHSPTDARIWKGILSNKACPKNIRMFLWKCLRHAHRIGTYWTKMQKPELIERGQCTHCGTLETMEHILFYCELNHTKSIWDLAKQICAQKDIPWPNDFHLAHVIASPLASFKIGNDRKRPGASRLFTIVISECAYEIWKMRCSRKLDHGEDEPEQVISKAEAENRVIKTINTRLTMDRLSTNSHRYGKSSIPPRLVLDTWSKVLRDEGDLPDDWLRSNGVLVGITPRRPNGRNR